MDDDFLAHYQLSYGFVKPEEEKKTEPVIQTKEEKPKAPEIDQTNKRKAQEPSKFIILCLYMSVF